MRDAVMNEDEHTISDPCHHHLKVEKEEEVSLSTFHFPHEH